MGEGKACHANAGALHLDDTKQPN
eukprot:SAG11_NODE_16315_length_551_cov_0.559735_1_plen_23_part_10